jgi:NAD(P)-dependent dehydrogenase (short-subunit alcohol dehydrogenase family)
MSSVVGVGGNAGQANYSASKAGMIGFTKSIAIELDPECKVQCYCARFYHHGDDQ